MPKRDWMKYIPCHRNQERSFVSGIQSLFCCRCTGMHLGFLLGFLYVVSASTFFVSSVSAANLVLMVPMLVDGLSQRAGWRKSDNVVRFATGILFGFGMVPFFGISETGYVQNFEQYLLFAVVVSVLFILLQKYALSPHLVRFFSSVSVVTYPTGLLLSAMLFHRFLVSLL